MNKQQFATLAIGIKSAYPASKILEDNASMDFWYMTLKDIPYEIAENAVMEHICTNVFPPNIAEIRKSNFGRRIILVRDYKKVCRCRDCGKIYDKGICFKLRLLPYATYNFPILFSNLPVVPVGQHFLLSCSTSHSGSFFKWCHKMKPACFEFVSIKSKAVSEDVSHNCNFLFWCVSIH